MMVCPNCKHTNMTGAMFCNECGFRLSDAAVNNNDAPPVVPPPPPVNPTYPPSGEQNIYQQPQQPYYPPAPEKKKGMGVVGWILIFLLETIKRLKLHRIQNSLSGLLCCSAPPVRIR